MKQRKAFDQRHKPTPALVSPRHDLVWPTHYQTPINLSLGVCWGSNGCQIWLVSENQAVLIHRPSLISGIWTVAFFERSYISCIYRIIRIFLWSLHHTPSVWNLNILHFPLCGYLQIYPLWVLSFNSNFIEERKKTYFSHDIDSWITYLTRQPSLLHQGPVVWNWQWEFLERNSERGWTGWHHWSLLPVSLSCLATHSSLVHLSFHEQKKNEKCYKILTIFERVMLHVSNLLRTLFLITSLMDNIEREMYQCNSIASSQGQNISTWNCCWTSLFQVILYLIDNLKSS